MWASDQIPRSSGVRRPSGVTAVASTITIPTPPTARLPRWTMCQGCANPSGAEYWHIGDITIRFRTVNPLMQSSEKSALMSASRDASLPLAAAHRPDASSWR